MIVRKLEEKERAVGLSEEKRRKSVLEDSVRNFGAKYEYPGTSGAESIFHGIFSGKASDRI